MPTPVSVAWELDVVFKSASPRRVWGWAIISRTRDGKVFVDKQGDVTEPEDIEEAAYDFVLKGVGLGGEMHEGVAQSRLIESMAFTPEKIKALGIPDGVLPVGHFVGYEVPEATYQRVVRGDRLMFSVEGGADVKIVEMPEDDDLAPLTLRCEVA